MKLHGNQPSAAETMKTVDNNRLLQIQEIKHKTYIKAASKRCTLNMM